MSTNVSFLALSEALSGIDESRFVEIAIATGATREDFDEDLAFDPDFDFGRRLKARRSGGHVDNDNDNDR